MGKFEKEAKDLLDAIGGKENVTAVSHCATRMRFVLGDDQKANVKAIEAIPVVKGTFTNAGQFQVIIGKDVPIFYNDFTAVSGIEGVSKEAAKSAAKSKQNPLQRVMATLAEIFTPLIPALIVGGLILGFRNVLEGVHIEALGRKIVDGVAQVKNGQPVYNTIVDVSKFWSNVNDFLWLPAQAVFHFLPVGITWSISRKMGTSQILGIVLGICLVSPHLLNAYDVANTSKDVITKDFTWLPRSGHSGSLVWSVSLLLRNFLAKTDSRSDFYDFCSFAFSASSSDFGPYGFRSFWLVGWTRHV